MIGRFAPSPSGYMHAGNLFSTLVSYLVVRAQGGRIVLRLEDLDQDRCCQKFADKIMHDYEAFGFTWDEGPYYQSTESAVYQEAFDKLVGQGCVYPCFCSRADLRAASAPHPNEFRVYQGTCKRLNQAERSEKLKLKNPSYRLDAGVGTYIIDDFFQGATSFDAESECGDFVIRRANGGFAYQLACVVDDARQGIDTVVRGRDLLNSAVQQRILQDKLGLPHVEYAHVPLFVNAEDGRRLSKRDEDADVEMLLDYFKSPERLIGHIAYLAGIIEEDGSCTPEELIPVVSDKPYSAWFASNDCIPWIL